MKSQASIGDLGIAARGERSGPLRTGLRQLGQSKALWYVAAIGVVLLAWQITIWITTTPDYLLPTPAQVADAMSTFRSTLVDEAWVTLKEIGISFVLSALLGVLIAIPIAFIPVVERLAYPLLVMSQAVPKIALGPIFIVWFGFGLRTNVIIAMSLAIFPVIVNTALGLSSIDPNVVRLGRSMGGSRWRVFRHLRLPIALPTIFAGLKIAITLATIGAVVGEFIVGGSGLGYLTISASGNQNVPLMFACVICLAVIGVVVFALVDLLERFALRHYPPQVRG